MRIPWIGMQDEDQWKQVQYQVPGALGPQDFPGSLAASDKCHTARFTAQSSHTQVLIGDIHGLTLSRSVAILMIGSFVSGILAKKKLEPKTVPPQGVSS